ncbi:MAG: hypothetical protein M3N53_12105 [Actinomycetota bacterium]|nr:hypothetical protein [Actinomycetota bacterium]
MTSQPRVLAAGGLVSVITILVGTLLLSLDDDWVAIAVLSVWLTTTAVVGALVLANRPENSVGPLMLAGAGGVALGLLAEAYASFVYEQGHPGLPLGMLAAWSTLWVTIPGFALFVHLFLRFPTGRLPSPWWRWVSRLISAGIVTSCSGYALRPGPIDGVPRLSNPLGGLIPGSVASSIISAGDAALTFGGLLAIVSLFVRFRRAATLERQQMKWFVLAVAAFPVLFLGSQLIQHVDQSEEEYAGFFVIVAALLFVPVTMGIGILRHRLYDIDVVVNRALVYGSLTSIVAGFYLGTVVLFQRVLQPITRESDLAVAGSTLAAAAVFRPLRARVQTFIDRRFYRRKYDAAETLGRFSARLRDQVDLESLTQELVGVVGTTMQPAHASIWLRQETAS